MKGRQPCLQICRRLCHRLCHQHLRFSSWNTYLVVVTALGFTPLHLRGHSAALQSQAVPSRGAALVNWGGRILWSLGLGCGCFSRETQAQMKGSFLLPGFPLGDCWWRETLCVPGEAVRGKMKLQRPDQSPTAHTPEAEQVPSSEQVLSREAQCRKASWTQGRFPKAQFLDLVIHLSSQLYPPVSAWAPAPPISV